MPKTKKPPAQSRFTVGDPVRVRAGMTDPDFPDMPLGGWAGRISEVGPDSPPLYLVAWSQETLASAHPVHRNRSEIDGLEFEQMWLGEEDLEPDAGGPLRMEQPTKIVFRELSMKNEDDRIRSVFGLTRDDPLPEVNDDSLTTYYKFFSSHLDFPFEAKWVREAGMGEMVESVTVLGLEEDENGPLFEDHYGLMCEAKMGRRTVTLPLAELEKVKGKPNRRLVADYASWFWG